MRRAAAVSLSALSAALWRHEVDSVVAQSNVAADGRGEAGGASGPDRLRIPPLQYWSSVAACKSPDNDAVDASQVQRAVEDVALLLDEHIHRLGSSSKTSHTLDVRSEGFRATFTVPRGAISAEALISGVRSAVRSLQSVSVSLGKQVTFGQEGQASSIRVQSEQGNLTIDLLQPFDLNSEFKMEIQGSRSRDSIALLRATMEVVCSPGGPPSPEYTGSPWGRFPRQEDPSVMFGNMEDIMRMLMEETRRAGVAMGELDGMGGEFFPRVNTQNPRTPPRLSSGPNDTDNASLSTDAERLAKTLEERGIRTYLPSTTSKAGDVSDVHVVDWRGLAGYETQKKQIEENLLLPLRRPDVFDEIAKKTRLHYSSNRPRAILFTGPPGTGKTSSARVIASQAGVPLCYIPLEAIASKWYGESEARLSEALELIDSGFPDGAVIFLDELDSLATTRGNDMHEATRRMLGVLLRFLDGFDQNKRAVVVGATNTPNDLDPALRSRFSATIEFGLPDEQCRVDILKQYAQHLSDDDVRTLARATPGFSGRDIRDVCGFAERHWATLIIKGTVHEGSTPGLKVYLEAARARRV